ncbi:hypothetical protein [Hyphomicrobium sp.]|jgi:hypothetical protein|uniref:hypothetical protein n=1 Tax=Hyphomicrobium sp. TaxID=82 RepID=UPI0035644C64
MDSTSSDRPVARAFASLLRNPFMMTLAVIATAGEAYNTVLLPAIVNTEEARIKIHQAENAATLLKAQADDARAKACEEMFKTYGDALNTGQPDVLKPCLALARPTGNSRVKSAETAVAPSVEDEAPQPNTGDPKLDALLTHLFGDQSKSVGTPKQ